MKLEQAKGRETTKLEFHIRLTSTKLLTQLDCKFSLLHLRHLVSEEISTGCGMGPRTRGTQYCNSKIPIEPWFTKHPLIFKKSSYLVLNLSNKCLCRQQITVTVGLLLKLRLQFLQSTCTLIHQICFDCMGLH